MYNGHMRIHTMNFRQQGFSLAILLLLLTGCVRRTPGTTSPATQTLPLQPGSSTPGGSISEFTATPKPPSINPTGSPTQASPDPTQALATPTPELETYNHQAWSDASPYGPWQVNFLVAYPEGEGGSLIGDRYYVRVELINLSSSQQESLIDEWRPYGLGFTIPQALRWTNNGQYLFLAETGNADGSGERFYDQLERVRLDTGQLQPLNLPGGSGESISPDGSQLALIDEERLAVIEIDTDQVETYNFDLPRVEWRSDQIFWSAQGQTILFNLRLNPFAPLDEMRSNLYLANLSTGEVKTLIADDRRRFSILSFPQESSAVLADSEAREWWLSLPDGAVRSEPPDNFALASRALKMYFNALQSGLYKEAAIWYGGSYEALQASNPDIPADDPAALFERACEVNGYQCLKVDSLLLKQVSADGRYLFEVSFTDLDGNLFILNPCCGADMVTQPPTWLFQYTVQQDANGRYKVMQLPVYVP